MSTSSSGLLTFLFTDIENSTQLWEKHHDAMQVALARHDAIMHHSIQSHQGQVFKTIGDAFCAVFANPLNALYAAVTAQRMLFTTTRNRTLGTGALVIPLRVRMALHAGIAEIRGGDYFGPPLNRVARILATGHGGQILLSATTLDFVGDTLPPETSLADLGEHRLKGIARPERIYQLNSAGLPSEFPPLRVADTFEAHYELVLKAMMDGRVIPCLGSEVNLCDRPADMHWQHGQIDHLPSSQELAAYLARNFEYPPNQPQDLVRVSQFISVVTGSGPLYEELHTLFDVDYVPTSLHQFLALWPGLLRAKGHKPRYQLIMTTNYDDALERAFKQSDEPFDWVSYVAEGEYRGKFLHRAPSGETHIIERPNEYRGLSLDQRTIILKIHGAVDRDNPERDSYVITEDHYIDYLTRTDIANLVPVTLAAKLRKSHYLFLGYSVRDWSLRVILHRIWGEQKLNYKSWAIQLHPQPLDQEYWRKRDVDILNVRLEDYIGALGERIQNAQAVAR